MTNNLTPPKISLAGMAKLAGPIFIANIAIIGGGTIDTVMAGQLGKDHLAAIALGLAATLCVTLALTGILMSLSPITGHHFGAREYPKIGEDLQQNLWLGVFLSLIGVPLLMDTSLWTKLGGVSGDVAHMASQYLIFSAIGLPGALFARTFISTNSALSRPKIPMFISIGTLLLKAPVNAVFMYGWFGLPAMGGAGAGAAYCVLTYLSLLVLVVIWRKDSFYKEFHSDRIWAPRWSLLREQLRIGIPIGLSTFFEVSSFTLMAIFVSRFGSEVISAHQIVSNITSMCYQVPLSLGIATSVLVSQSLGARWPSVAYEALKRSLKLVTSVALVIVLALFFTRGFIMSLYTSDAGVIKLGTSVLIFGCIYHVFDAMQCVSSFALRGYRVTRAPMIIYGVMLWAVGLGGGYIFGFGAEWAGGPYGIFGFWGATTVGLILTGIALSTMAIVVGRRNLRRETHTPEEVAAAIREATH
ncbi:MAG: MATE family efflux transporter [Burkholderia sp.]|jgi:multidrug resistance protein, MATE family